MGLIEELTAPLVLTKGLILQYVDDYTLFDHYIEQDVVINVPIISPLRGDDTAPSFTVFQAGRNRLVYRDFGALEDSCKSGDVFKFLSLKYGLTIYETLKKINYDFQLGLGEELIIDKPIIKTIPKIKQRTKLRITSKDKFSPKGEMYWNQYFITPKILDIYNVTEVAYLFSDSYFFEPSTLCFAYRIGDKYKLYSPYGEKAKKFRNNYPTNYVEGYLQLQYKSDTLIITKSLKDVMVLNLIGFEAISPKAENVMIPKFILRNLEKRYKRIVMLFDPDEAGYIGSAKYDYPAVFLENGYKDVSDYLQNCRYPEVVRQTINILTK